jgi:cytochrome c biogenesis protein CcdA/thiol-disulfide isomerase/thioredoxin
VLIGLVGGFVTGVSPCVLPVLPVVFLSGGVQARRPGAKPDPRQVRAARRRPYLVVAGLALSFSLVTLLGTLVVSALPVPDDIIRWAGLVVLVVLGVAMMFEPVQDLLERPFTRIRQRQVGGGHGGFVLGLALGAVYVPCAGPVLAAITVAGATGRIGPRTVALTVAFAVGAAVPLLIFALAGRGVAERVRAFRDRQRGVRFAAGLVIIVLAVALTFNVTDALQRTVPDYTAGLNKNLDKPAVTNQLGPHRPESLAICSQEQVNTPRDCGPAPAISGIDGWLNTPGGARPDLAGKVVLVDFWAYSCINCQRAIPHVQAWYSTYQKYGLVVVGVHTPEYAFEHVPGNVAAGAGRLHITYPVALDNDYTTWNNFTNQSWPAEYLIDATGEVRHVAIGEGDYGNTESLIRQLLTAAHPGVQLPIAPHLPDATPTEQQTPETYLGSLRANTFVLGQLTPGTRTFAYPAALPQDQFALTGGWSVSEERITAGKGAGIQLNFAAREVYLDVGGTGTVTATLNGRTTSYAVSGAPNIYTVVGGRTPSHGILTLTLSPGLDAYSFTFG